MKRYIHVVVIVTLIMLTIVLSAAFALGGIALYLPPRNVRSLAEIFLKTTFNPEYRISPMSPEAVTAIVWDYRGLDTLFETSVMFLAIVGALTLFRGLSEKLSQEEIEYRGGLSVIVKTVTRIAIVMIIAVGASLALHGHLTPGGGFQGGATIAVAPMLIIITFSTYYMSRSISVKKAVLLRSIGLSVIALTTFLVLIIALTQNGTAYIFQNQPKVYADYGIPSYLGDTIVLGGTLLLFNAAETFAVAFGFIALLILITIPEDYAKTIVLEGEE